MKSINITPIFNTKFLRADTIAFAKIISWSMHCLWAGEGPIKSSSKSFVFITTMETKIFSVENFLEEIRAEMENIFTDEVIKQITEEKNNKVCYLFEHENFDLNFETKTNPHPHNEQNYSGPNGRHRDMNTKKFTSH